MEQLEASSPSDSPAIAGSGMSQSEILRRCPARLSGELPEYIVKATELAENAPVRAGNHRLRPAEIPFLAPRRPALRDNYGIATL